MPLKNKSEEIDDVILDTEEDDVYVEEDEEQEDDESTDTEVDTEIQKKKEENDEDEELDDNEDNEIKDLDILQIEEIANTDVDTVRENVTPNNERISKPYLNKYEKTRVLATRSKQLSLGAKPLIKVESSKKLSPYEIAVEELKNKMTPYIIRRKMPSGKYEYWKISELEDIYTR